MSILQEYNKKYRPPKQGEPIPMIGVMPGSLLAQITPSEAEAFTGIRVNPLPENTEELGKQVGDGAKELEKEKAFQFIKGLIVNPKMKLIRKTIMAPILNMPDLEKEYLEEINKKRLMF